MTSAEPAAEGPAQAPVVLITGAGRRIGRAMALACAQAGWRVAVHYRQSREEAMDTVAKCLQWTGGGAVFDANLADEQAVRALLPRVVAEMGRIDAVVNSAALFEHDAAASFGYAAMERHWRINSGAPIVLAQALASHLQQRGAGPASGCVVNLLDQKLFNPNPDYLSYTLSKAALQAATPLLAQALAPTVRVVGVAPGLTLTSPVMSEADFARLHRLSPLGRSSTPEDVASAVVFALGNRSVTGTTLLVDGGQHLMRFERDFAFMKP
jgi:NAD(P)-dependent dehydrogenase (short-subunit alcohol dehydrogenase family)